MVNKFISGLIAAASVLTAVAPATASITLAYNGPAFTSGSADAGTNITGYVVLQDFDTSVEQNPNASNLVDWSISNGAFTLSQANGNTLLRFDMLIAAGGQVIRWAFDAQDTPDANWTEFSRTDSANFDISEIKDNSYSGVTQNVGPSGSWSIASDVPEPGSWGMILFGFGAMGSVLRSRRKAAVGHCQTKLPHGLARR